MRAASPPIWEEHLDPSSGKKFFFNPSTNETSWTKPSAAGYPSAPAKKSDGWTEHRDPASGKIFYFNTETKETSWQKPASHASNGTPSGPAYSKSKLDLDPPDPWTEHVDPDSGRAFFYNSVTKESAWLRPSAVARRPPAGPAQQPLAPVPGPPAVPPAPARATPSPAPAPPTQWEEHVDPGSGRRFFYNPFTQESSWIKPTSTSSCPPPAPPAKRSDGWTEHRDPASGKLFYFNTESKETSWHAPVPGTSAVPPPPAASSAPARAIPSPAPAPPTQWEEHVDHGSGRRFFYNPFTQESSWIKPTSTSSCPPPAPPAKRSDGWTEHRDPASGKLFYFNTESGQSSWELPQPSPSNELLLLMCFDFDCTIAAIHVFEALDAPNSFVEGSSHSVTRCAD